MLSVYQRFSLRTEVFRLSLSRNVTLIAGGQVFPDLVG